MLDLSVTDIERLTSNDLRAVWSKVFRTDPPKCASRSFLVASLIYRIKK